MNPHSSRRAHVMTVQLGTGSALAGPAHRMAHSSRRERDRPDMWTRWAAVLQAGWEDLPAGAVVRLDKWMEGSCHFPLGVKGRAENFPEVPGLSKSCLRRKDLAMGHLGGMWVVVAYPRAGQFAEGASEAAAWRSPACGRIAVESDPAMQIHLQQDHQSRDQALVARRIQALYVSEIPEDDLGWTSQILEYMVGNQGRSLG